MFISLSGSEYLFFYSSLQDMHKNIFIELMLDVKTKKNIVLDLQKFPAFGRQIYFNLSGIMHQSSNWKNPQTKAKQKNSNRVKFQRVKTASTYNLRARLLINKTIFSSPEYFARKIKQRKYKTIIRVKIEAFG